MSLSFFNNASRSAVISHPKGFFKLPRELRDMIVGKSMGRKITFDLRLRVNPTRRFSKTYANPLTYRFKYDTLLADGIQLSRRSGFRLWLRNVACPHLLHVSSQFYHELQQRNTKGPHLIIEDQFWNTGLGHVLDLTPRWVNLSSIELHLTLSCASRCHKPFACRILSCLHMHGGAISFLMSRPEFSTVRRLSLSLYLRPHEFVAGCEEGLIDCFNAAGMFASRLRDPLRILDQWNQLSSCDVNLCDFGDNGRDLITHKTWNFSGKKIRIMEYCRETQSLKRVKAHGNGPYERSDKTDGNTNTKAGQ